MKTKEEIETICSNIIDSESVNEKFKQAVYEGAILGYTQCQEDMADKWISVENRLPEESGRYLGYLKELNDLGNSFSIINVAFNVNHKDSTAWTEHGEVLQYITHWMPLPNEPLNKLD